MHIFLHNVQMGFAANKSFRLERGLYLEERKGAACYKARASIKGIQPPPFFNTETSDYATAERLARSWFKRLSADPTPDSPPRHRGRLAEPDSGFPEARENRCEPESVADA